MTENKKKRSPRIMIGLVSAGVVLVLICLSVFVLKILMTDEGQKRKRQIQMVRLMKPPPPPKIKEKPPEPEVKKEEIIEPEEEEPPPEQTEDQSQDDTPAGDDLGLDAEGGAGSDGFGLVGKKGGRSLIGGGWGNNSLLRKYSWYIRFIEEEISKRLARNGGIPSDKLKTLVRIVLDEVGTIVDYRIYASSGNQQMDDAVMLALEQTEMINEPPPEGMPRVVRIEITSPG